MPSPRVNMAPGPPSRAGGPLIPSEKPGRERGGQGGADAWLKLPGRTRTPSSLGPDREELKRPAGGRFRSLRVRRVLTRRLQTDASACSPEKRERERKKTFIETIQPAAAEKTERPPELSPPPPERQAGGSATPAGGREGGGAQKAGRGIPGKPPPRGWGFALLFLHFEAVGRGWEG